MKKKNPKKLLLKTFTIENSFWITNFWFFDKKLFLTDSVFDNEKNLFGYVSIQSLNNNFVNKKTREYLFMDHPDPTISSALKSSNTEVEVLKYSDDFIYNVCQIDEKLYVAYISPNKKSGYTKVYDLEFNYLNEKIEDYLIFGIYNKQLLFIKVQNRKLYLYETESSLIVFDHNLKKVIPFNDKTVVLTDDFKVYLVDEKEKWKLLYKSSDVLEVAKFNDHAIVISTKATQKTFYLDIDDLTKQKQLIDEYFYHLVVLENKILIGKPLYLNHKFEDYQLPLKVVI